MAKTHARSPSPAPNHSSLKRPKLAKTTSDPSEDFTPYFASHLFDHDNVHRLNAAYRESEPYKYAVVDKLFQDNLLHKVKSECLHQLHFTEKETDIYKVNQTGDLASLSYLDESQLALLPNILKLRDALYSPTFRSFIRTVTGCGPLSGTKQDMSVNSYRKGCHLLNHDDVIGSRRVSYILYIPLPPSEEWKKEWGGALELYPVREGPDGILEPEPIPTKSIPPSWNQFIFFEVQPGRSFHSVEEVVVDEGEDGRQRLSVSGWFHAAQLGEEGHEPEEASDLKSSREQLTSTSTSFKTYAEEPPFPGVPLSQDDISFLSEFLNPVYLEPRTMKSLAKRFVEESSVELHDFLCTPLADKLRTGLREIDVHDGLSEARPIAIPPHSAGTGNGWTIKGPPHKWRYCVLEPRKDNVSLGAPAGLVAQTPGRILRAFQDELFASPAFRAWLVVVSRLIPMRHAVEARRFCPGLGYTLATSEENEARLDVVLGLTPQVGEVGGESVKGKDKADEPRGWQSGEWGGWECYMAPHGEEDDPAVYRSGPSRSKASANGLKEENGANGKDVTGVAHTSPHNGHIVSNNTTKKSSPGDADDAMDEDDDSEGDSDGKDEGEGEGEDEGEDEGEGEGEGDDDDDDEEEEDGTLLTVQPGFNSLLLVLRDEGVMRFVKYVSASAEGSRWDVCGEYEVGMVEEDDE
ncbi:hypothetical protein HETIRDRAFT_433015 [Heterobasidion irregulare TC 32-1]|uniref:uS12 prolyl 3,4-dihydroxylase n=1 Tax=Heterobasidion irregulare (strain TC 32-1) TaxID=747525 RepID=W4KG33_HETIT|nr:uncharacterized protein HETIRDRAFT_433015 [Heterobasidion irregulare TC 32-1]ETW84031.1 hypothetical protein HETIRDRAFT_433015 [Heterobasidion irregulare TC 32-1]